MIARLLFVVILALTATALPMRGETKSRSASGDDVPIATTSATTPQNGATAVRQSQQKAGRYFIEFRSRYALTYGHTYVIFGRMDKSGKMIDRDVAGLHPVMLSEAEYRQVVAYIRKLQARSHFWQATVSNCNAFVGNIARSMGYKTPGIWLRPRSYVIKLRDMNGGPNAIGYTGPPG